MPGTIPCSLDQQHTDPEGIIQKLKEKNDKKKKEKNLFSGIAFKILDKAGAGS